MPEYTPEDFPEYHDEDEGFTCAFCRAYGIEVAGEAQCWNTERRYPLCFYCFTGSFHASAYLMTMEGGTLRSYHDEDGARLEQVTARYMNLLEKRLKGAE